MTLDTGTNEGKGREMNVDDAMTEVETTIRRNPRLFSSHHYEVASVLAKEVERLRAELAEAKADKSPPQA
jgi:hypothetical protein